MASIGVKSERFMTENGDMRRRILVKREEAKKDRIGGQMGEGSHYVGDTNPKQSCAFGVLEKHPPLQHVVSVSGCGVTFNIEITGLTYVSVDIVEPYITISKEEALQWLELLGYKQENMFQIDNETKELVNYSEVTNYTTVSADAQTNRSDIVGLGHELDELSNPNVERGGADITLIKQEPLFDDELNCEKMIKRKSSDENMFKKIILEKDVSEENAYSLVISQSDEPIIKNENYICEMPGGVEPVEAMDSSLTVETENTGEDQDNVATATNQGNNEEDNMQDKAAITMRPNPQGTGTDEIKRKCKCSSTFYFGCDFCRQQRNDLGDQVQSIGLKGFQAESINDWKCKVCSYETDSCTEYVTHQTTHSDDGAMTCYCGYTTKHTWRFKRHIITYTQNKPYNCNLCEYSGACARGLKVHEGTHRAFKCALCPYGASESRDLTKHHLRMHTKQRSHKCALCPYAACTPAEVKAHMRMHTKMTKVIKQRPYKCTQCLYSASSQASLESHMLTHSKETHITVLCVDKQLPNQEI